jgi:sensor histidine kinase regulating citrate/malate metabolism
MRAADEDTDRDNDLAEVRSHLAELEGRLDEANVQLIWDQAVRELHTHQAWKQLTDRMTNYRAMAIEQLASRRMDGYELGQVQGRLAMLRVLTQLQPIPMDQLDRIKQHASNLQAQIEDQRNLLR